MLHRGGGERGRRMLAGGGVEVACGGADGRVAQAYTLGMVLMDLVAKLGLTGLQIKVRGRDCACACGRHAWRRDRGARARVA